MQFNLIDLWASKDYKRNIVDLPIRNFGAVATNIWKQTRDRDDPGNMKDDKAERTDDKAENYI